MSEESRIQIIEWDMMDRNKFLSLTVVNSLFLRSVLYPLVLVKTRLQIQKQNTVYTGSLDAFKKIIRTEGFCGLYKGFWINSIQAFSGITFIATYEKTRDIISNYSNISDNKTKAFLSGGISSAVSQTLIIPFDIVSQHIMMAQNYRRLRTASANATSAASTPASNKTSNNHHHHHHNQSMGSTDFKSTFFKPLNVNQNEMKKFGIALAIARQLYNEGGFRSFYKGYFASLLLFVPSSASWWMLYQELNEILYKWPAVSDKPYIFLHCISGTLCGAAVAVMTNPFDLLRANIQVHRPSSYRSAAKYLWKEDKWRIFSKGLTARMTQGSLSSALIVIGYETMKRFSIDEKYRDQVRW